MVEPIGMSTRDTTIDASDCTRDEIILDDGREGRLYEHPALDKPMLSVTTVTDIREDEDKDAAINGWRDWYDGRSKKRSPHWAEQLLYKQLRGTLAHYAALSEFGAPYTEEEERAEKILKNWSEWRPAVKGIEVVCPNGVNGDMDFDVPLRGDINRHRGVEPWKKCMRDVSYFCNTFDAVLERNNVASSDIIDAETYVLETDYGYAGQFDLLYENEDGEVVLSDLKTSKIKDESKESATKEDHRIQLGAYAYAYEGDVDRIECVNIYPDTEKVRVEDDTDWEHDIDYYQDKFLNLVERAHQAKIDSRNADSGGGDGGGGTA